MLKEIKSGALIRTANACVFYIIIVLLPHIGYSAADISYEDWVYAVYENKPETTLRDMVIPGTHDSGTYNLNSHSDVSPDSPAVYALAKGIVADWGKSQSFDFHMMLRMGVRHFDLRIQKHQGHFVLVHGLIGMKLDDALSQVKHFADAHPMEPIILEVAKVPSSDDIGPMIDVFDLYLRHRRVNNTIPLAQITLGDIWKKDQYGQNFNIIVVFRLASDHGHRRGYFSGDHQFTGTWADTEDEATLKSRLINGSLHTGRFDPGLKAAPKDKLFYSTFTFTPKTSTIVKDVVNLFSSGSLLKWTQEELRPLMGEWVLEWVKEGLRPNIMTTDFFEYTALMPLVIALNQREEQVPEEKLHYKVVTNSMSMWSSDSTHALHYVEMLRPVPEKGYSILGDVALSLKGEKVIKTLSVKDDQPGVARPAGYNWVWNDRGTGASRDLSVWRPIPQAGYICLGDIVTNNHGIAPPKDIMQCVHKSYLKPANVIKWQWDDVDSGGDYNLSLWHAEDVQALPLEVFKGGRHHAMPDKTLFWIIDETKVIEDA
ncbi:MAG: Vps62-related protein [Cellvibrionales bacterium]|nr:Vps62-related protein [Cellvibrionales bacterium]